MGLIQRSGVPPRLLFLASGASANRLGEKVSIWAEMKGLTVEQPVIRQ